MGQLRMPSTASSSSKSSSGGRVSRSILFTNVKMGMPRWRQTLKSFLVWASTPFAPSMSITAASVAASVR